MSADLKLAWRNGIPGRDANVDSFARHNRSMYHRFHSSKLNWPRTSGLWNEPAQYSGWNHGHLGQ
jgi:hypothetical protein